MARTVPYGEGRDQLIAAAVQVAAERGLRGLTFRAVAERAGVNNSLIAHHFGTRETLLSAALDWAVEQSIDTTALPEMASDEAFADSLLRTISQRPELQVFQYEMILEARRNETYRPAVSRLYARYQEAIAASLRPLVATDDTDAVARATFAALDGLVLQYMAGVDPDEIHRALRQVWEGLRALPQIAGTR
ncbi:TetR/AcrR family transcriptional regulator [Microbacterium sp.]|uniref:TetR/AcrR family transcriptional regulator n=1 Tax=Microbacterium sp. TaxID=51671 RepID=UPI003A8394B9